MPFHSSSTPIKLELGNNFQPGKACHLARNKSHRSGQPLSRLLLKIVRGWLDNPTVSMVSVCFMFV